MDDQLNTLTILRLKQVKARTGLSCSTIYLRMSLGTFPKNIPLGGPGAVGWIESEINDWIRRRIEAARAV